MIDNFIAYEGASYIRAFTVVFEATTQALNMKYVRLPDYKAKSDGTTGELIKERREFHGSNVWYLYALTSANINSVRPEQKGNILQGNTFECVFFIMFLCVYFDWNIIAVCFQGPVINQFIV